MQILLNTLRSILRIDYIKSIYINLRLLPFSQAIRLPLIVSYATTIESLSGKLIINGNCKTALLRFGFLHNDLFSWNASKTFLNIKGTLLAKGWAQFGVGCSISVDTNAVLSVGDNCSIGANALIICRESIEIGSNFRGAWGIQITDTNFHYIKDISDGSVHKKTKAVKIGNNNWFANRTSIMQGTVTPDFFCVASNSICNKNYKEIFPAYSLVGGSPAKLLKSNLVRVLDKEEREIDKLFVGLSDEVVYTDKTPRPK